MSVKVSSEMMMLATLHQGESVEAMKAKMETVAVSYIEEDKQVVINSSTTTIATTTTTTTTTTIWNSVGRYNIPSINKLVLPLKSSIQCVINDMRY